MNDGNLLAFGCAVSFTALAGAYVFMRGRYEAATKKAKARTDAKRDQRMQRVA
ncbi:MAG: hypothetical protein ACQGVC_19390 [Myxococcota bacterium]